MESKTDRCRTHLLSTLYSSSFDPAYSVTVLILTSSSILCFKTCRYCKKCQIDFCHRRAQHGTACPKRAEGGALLRGADGRKNTACRAVNISRSVACARLYRA